MLRPDSLAKSNARSARLSMVSAVSPACVSVTPKLAVTGLPPKAACGSSIDRVTGLAPAGEPSTLAVHGEPFDDAERDVGSPVEQPRVEGQLVRGLVAHGFHVGLPRSTGIHRDVAEVE